MFATALKLSAAAAVFAFAAAGSADARSRHAYDPYSGNYAYAGQYDPRAYNQSYDDVCEVSADRQIAGLALGAILGGALGNGLAGDGDRGLGTVIGMVLGGAAGAAVARHGGCDDEYAAHASYDAFEHGQAWRRVSWNNPDSGSYGYVTPADWHENEYGEDCREFTQVIFIEGRRTRAYGTACRDENGDWRIVE